MSKRITLALLLLALSIGSVWGQEKKERSDEDAKEVEESFQGLDDDIKEVVDDAISTFDTYNLEWLGLGDIWDDSEDEDAPPPSHAALNLPIEGYGLSFGNSKRNTGIRFNFVDHHVEKVTGFNFSFWRPKPNPEFEMSGIGFGLAGTRALQFDGIAITGSGPVAREMNGISLALAGSGFGDMNGISIAGLGSCANDITGITVSGLGTGADDVTGISINGLGMGANDVMGVTVAGLGMGANDVTGLTVAGMGANNIAGFALGGFRIKANRITGAGIGGGMLQCNDLTGLGVGAFQHVKGMTRGLSIGVLNMTEELEGIQIGLLKHVAENPPLMRWLPVINWHFD